MIEAATTALAAAVLATTPSLPVFARELQPLATAAPEQVGMSAERLSRITAVLKKEIADGKLPGAVVMVARREGSSIRTPSASRTRARIRP